MHTLKLEKTVFHRGRFIREMTVREPTQADADQACAESDTPAQRGIALVSIITGLDPVAAVKMCDADLERIQALVDGWAS